MLDSLYSQTEEWINARLDNIDKLIGDIIQYTNENASNINETLKEMADLYLLITMCDRQPEREEEALELLKKHVEQFETLYKKTEV